MAESVDSWLTIDEAARAMGISPSGVRRKMKAGLLEREELIRPQGTTYLVRVPEQLQVTACALPPPNEAEPDPEPLPAVGEAPVAAPTAGVHEVSPGPAGPDPVQQVVLTLLDRVGEGHVRELELATRLGEARGALLRVTSDLELARSEIRTLRARAERAERLNGWFALARLQDGPAPGGAQAGRSGPGPAGPAQDRGAAPPGAPGDASGGVWRSWLSRLGWLW